jgi:hypothetical protein
LNDELPQIGPVFVWLIQAMCLDCGGLMDETWMEGSRHPQQTHVDVDERRNARNHTIRPQLIRRVRMTQVGYLFWPNLGHILDRLEQADEQTKYPKITPFDHN